MFRPVRRLFASRTRLLCLSAQQLQKQSSTNVVCLLSNYFLLVTVLKVQTYVDFGTASLSRVLFCCMQVVVKHELTANFLLFKIISPSQED